MESQRRYIFRPPLVTMTTLCRELRVKSVTKGNANNVNNYESNKIWLLNGPNQFERGKESFAMSVRID